MARHPQGAAGRKTSAAGRRRGTLSPRAAGPSSRARRCFSDPQPSAPSSRVDAACARIPPRPRRRRHGRRLARRRVPAAAATWTAPATVSAPHTFVAPLEAASSGNGTARRGLALPGRRRQRRATGARGAALLPGAAAFGRERTLPGATTQVVPYAQRSVAALAADEPRSPPARRVRLSVAFGSADGPSLGTARSVAVDDVAFVPRLAVGSDGSGLLAWIARASGARRVVKVSLRAPGGRFGAPSIISGTGRANTITAAVGPQGQRVVAFERGGRLLARYRTANGSWGPIQDLGAVARGTDNQLAALITSGGRAMIADVHRQLTEGGDTGPLLVDAWVRAGRRHALRRRPAPRAGRRRRGERARRSSRATAAARFSRGSAATRRAPDAERRRARA